MIIAKNRFVLSVVSDVNCEFSQSLASALTYRGHFVRVFNQIGKTKAACHGCYKIEEIPEKTIVITSLSLDTNSFLKLKSISQAVIQLCQIQRASLKHAIWNSKTSFWYSNGAVGRLQRLESHKTIEFFAMKPSQESGIRDKIRDKILVYSTQIDYENCEPYDESLLDRAKAVVINSRFGVEKIRGFHILRLLEKKIPVICWNLTECAEYIDHEKSGFIVDSEAELIESLSKIDEIKDFDTTLSKFSAEIILEKYEKAFCEAIGVPFEDDLGFVDTFCVGECVKGFNMHPEYIWDPNPNKKINDWWRLCDGNPRKVSSISDLANVLGISQISKLIIHKHDFDCAIGLYEDLNGSNLRPMCILFSEECSQEGSCKLEKLGFVKVSDKEFTFPQTKIIGYEKKFERLCIGFSDILSQKSYIFEEIARGKLQRYYKIISNKKLPERLSERVLSPKDIYAIDLKAFPRKFHPESLKTIGIVGKPKMKVIGKMVDGKIQHVEDTDPQSWVVSTAKSLGLTVKYINEMPFGVTFELYRGIDLLVSCGDSFIGQSAIEAACCGVPVVSTSKGLLESINEMLKFDSKQRLVEILSELLIREKFIEYRDIICNLIPKRFDMDKLDFSFLK